MKNEVAKKSSAGQLKLREAMLSFKYRQFRNPLERMAYIENDGAVQSPTVTSLAIKKIREMIENVVNDLKPENTPDVKVSTSVAYDFIKRHAELKTSKPKIVDANRLAVSCQQVLKLWYDMLNGLHRKNNCNNAPIFNVDDSSLRVPDSSNRNVVHPTNAKPVFAKSAEQMANSTLIAAFAADGQSLPSAILWTSLKLSDDLKPLQSINLEILQYRCGWMESSKFRKYALAILLPSIKERRQLMSLDELHCLLRIDSHISQTDPTIL
ncbi:uncharacterized protein MONOS_4355 [Monocercomonoides exilis]|uniref:uncharacterized protein n=1 Tax=Monocercomonoides exilis TaxID=2049356 RepID=UPI00355AA681|nr:hypothetical protein MONOS_4355 [Monocercomonoides exilis]|eukprot:MONOS_4355.1-p1 / transcript=MONOS_4355.1 / gene=MONOS_4355 / organism=Monocercomonoides_exilis_PA203 / gene_product=unspecified product / transcript_product=unspecified product / location=Mono_scaffold00114:118197-119198(+) / protein_length=267 / sequence_SO=supercontig / SO=protein_coding / is_pseudo=false